MARETTVPRSSWRERLLFVLLLLAARGVLLVALADVFTYGEELEKAAAGKAMLDGLEVEHHRLAYHYYEGGGFVVSHLDALVFALFGQSVLALKLVPLAFDVLILLAGLSLCERHFGRAGARILGLFFVLAPESFQKLSLLALGIHFEAVLFVFLVLDLALRAWEGEARRRTWFLLGLAAGLGTYFNYQVALTAAFAAGALVLRRPREVAGKSGLAAALGAALGLAPLAWMWALAGDSIFDIHGASLEDAGLEAGATQRLPAFLGSVFLGRSPWDLLGLAAAWAAPLAGAAAAARLAGERRAKLLLVSAYLAFHAAALALSGFLPGAVYHYFLFDRASPVWAVSIVLAAGGLAAWLESPARAARSAALALTAVLALAGILGAARAASRGSPSTPLENLALLARSKGYRYEEYAGKIQAHLEGGTRDKLRVLSGFDEPERDLLQAALASSLFASGEHRLEDVLRLARELAPEHWQGFVLGLGPMWRDLHGGTVASRARAAAQVRLDVRPLLEEAVGRFGQGWLVSSERLREEIDEGLSAGLPAAFFRGAGYRLFLVRGSLPSPRPSYHELRDVPFAFSPPRARSFLEEQDERVRPWLREGYERAVREHALP